VVGDGCRLVGGRMKDSCPSCESGLPRVATMAGMLCPRCADDLARALEGDR
jgi:predicted RNA-binding Zn-ribbon protein involved in translation (DUF1610 family)